MRRFDQLIAVGETMAAVVPDPPGPLETADAFSIVTAGAESNVAVCAAQLGLPSAWLSRLGDDALGRRITASVSSFGVDVSRVTRSTTESTGLMVKDPSGENTRVQYYRRGSAAALLSVADLDPLFPVVGPGTLIHTTGVTPALSESCRELVAAIVVERRIRGASVSFDVNHRPALWTDRSASNELSALARASDVCFVGLDEAEVLWGTRVAANVRSFLPEPGVLVVKDGGVGATVFHGGAELFVPAPPVTVREPVGAGDAFAGGFLAAWAAGGDARHSARVGHAVAAAVLRSVSDTVVQPRLDSFDTLASLSDSEWIEWPLPTTEVNP